MRSFDVVVQLDESALLVGGQSAPRLGGDKATARDSAGRPVIPASALRGALRLELERLLRGRDGGATACSANRPASAVPPPACGCPVCRVFGEEGGATGTLRLEDAELEEGSGATALRPGVAVGRRTGTAAAGHLALFETAAGEALSFRARGRLVPLGAADTEADLARDLENLQAACRALKAIGGGRARGLGWVFCSLQETAEQPAQEEKADPPAASDLTLRFAALAPLHLGQGRPVAFFQPTSHHAPGSTVRGALAFTLLEHGLSRADDADFQEVFAGEKVSFGSARLEGDLPSATRRRCRPDGHVFDDLVGELVRRAAAGAGVALALGEGGGCPAPGCRAAKVQPWSRRAGAPRAEVRVRTRTALNRRTGTAMDRKLYSVETLEPAALRPVEGKRDQTEPLVLAAEVRGLSAGGAALLGRLAGREVWLGGKRTRGMGRCRLSLAAGRAADGQAALGAAEELGAALKQAWQALRGAAGADLPESLVPAGRLPFALVLAEPWDPGDGAETALLRGPLPGEGPELLDAFVILAEEGRFGANEADRYGAPDKVLRGELPPRRVAAPGSVYVYTVERRLFEERLASWLDLGRHGVGANRELGWGRFLVRGPEADF